MGDISMRGKGRALKMKEGGKATRDLVALQPKIAGRLKKRTDGAMKRRAEEESMKELRYPTNKPKRRRPERPERPEREFRPMPLPMPRPDRPNMKPMPYKKPILPKDLEKYFMKTPKRVRPAMKKDGGEMMGLKSLLSKGAFSGVGVSLEKLKKALDKGPIKGKPLPMTPELIKKFKNKMVPNPRAQQSERDRSKPIIGKPMRRSSAKKNNG